MVPQVQVFGAAKYADSQRLSAYTVGLNEIAAALSYWNVNLPPGTLPGANRSYNVLADGETLRTAGTAE